MSTIKVEILVALLVPHATPFALDNIDVEERVYIIEFHFPLLLEIL